MSTIPTVDDFNLDTTTSLVFIHTPTSYDYAVRHVFFPVELPHNDDYTPENDLLLARAVCAAAHAYSPHVKGTPQWHCITNMLDNLGASTESEQLDSGQVISQLCGMRAGDVVVFFIRPQNAALILTKRENCTLFESFEVSPSSNAVRETMGSLMCSYPWSAVEMPNEVFDDEHFQFELANFLSRPYFIESDLAHAPRAGPQYITALLTGILRGVGHTTADVPRITKRVRDHVGQWPVHRGFHGGDWRRSSLWLLIRATIQMSGDRSPPGRIFYKRFILFFICTLAKDPNHTNLSGDLLHLMSSKIFRRLSKLGSATSDWLSTLALNTCTSLREILDARWKPLSICSSQFRNPSQDELRRDTRLSLLDSREHIHNALANHGHDPLHVPFHPNHRRRGTIEDFLSLNGSFFEGAYHADPAVTLYDVEQSIEQGIDEWIACVTDVEEACAQLEILMDKYVVNAHSWLTLSHPNNPEGYSIMLLTAVELFVALDKLVVKKVPMLADYSPEIPIALLQGLLLRKTTGLHRLTRAYQYISSRHSRKRLGWPSVLSNEFTEASFAVRYYDQSPRLQRLKTHIEDAILAEHDGVQPSPVASVVHAYDEHEEYCQHIPMQRLTEGAKVSLSPLPPLPLHAKVVVFELHCPTCVRIWRSAAARMFCYLDESLLDDTGQEDERNLLARVPALRRYFVHREESPLPLHFQIRFAYFYPGNSQSRSGPTLRYALRRPKPHNEKTSILSIWQPKECYDNWHLSSNLKYKYDNNDNSPSNYNYVNFTCHTSNDVLAAQAYCPAGFSLDEFIAFGHLRSSGSLQWLNILRGLRSRTLNLHYDHVHFLLACAASQVGPLDLDTGVWVWHKELQDSLFCNALLDELDSLLMGGWIDGMLTSTISLLLNRVLASSPSERVSSRAIALLRSVRKKTFDWVQELLYDLVIAPMNEERSNLLCNMAATCRSTFDVDPATLHKVRYSAEDVDALLSCALLIHAFRPRSTNDRYSQMLLQRNDHLSLAVEGILSDAILADASDYGIDLAVGKIFAGHQPSVHRWRQLQHQDARWLTCETNVTRDQSSQTVHLNLLNGELRVDGRSLDGLLCAIRDFPEMRQIFHDQGFFLVPSNLPGMDFTTLAPMSKYKVHFSMRDDSLVVRAQCDETNDILELIPSTILRWDLPPVLVDGHVHWLNLSTKLLEIRPLERLWERSSENWTINCASGQYRVYKGRETLVDIRSPTWAMASKCFECLNIVYDDDCYDDEDLGRLFQNLLITVSPVKLAQSVRLSVALPCYDLSFFVNEQGELESREFKDMIYDENQCIGTLFGLRNLLVLRQKTHLPEGLIPRRVLVPNGFPEKHGDHQVRIYTESRYITGPNEPLYHAYNVDTELGCLAGNSSLISTRYLAYLHAVTSCHRPDPLTGKTGAQAALSLLQSAGCRSIMKLKALDDGDHWTSTQYPQINAAHEEIEQRYYWNLTLYEREAIIAVQKRAARRAAHLFPSSATGPPSPEDGDDMERLIPDSDLELEDIVFTAASAIHRWSAHAPTMDTILDWAGLWNDNTNKGSPASPMSPGGHPDLVQTLVVKVHNILEGREGTRYRFQLLFLLPTVAYCSPSHQAAFLSMLIAFTKQLQSYSGTPPIHVGCNISDGYRPAMEVILHHVPRSPREEQYFQSDSVVKYLLKDWPSATPPMISLDSRYWDVAGLTTRLRELFSSCYRNLKLKEHLSHILAGSGVLTFSRPVSFMRDVCNVSIPLQITLDQLLSNRSAPTLPLRRAFLRDSPKDDKTTSDDISALDQLFSSLLPDPSIQREYIAHLDASAQHLRRESRVTHGMVGVDRIEALHKHYVQCRLDYMDGLAALKQSLSPTTDPHQRAVDRFSQWPPITAGVLLQCLATTSTINLPGQWKKCLISLALLLLDLQRSRRLLRFALEGLEEEFSKELENEGCDGWDPEEFPDWLLVQIQGNFLIRRVQAETARMMIFPKSGRNFVMQVNMGEGKSSVIVPIVAAALADGKQLIRVIVPKALTVQMFELLVSRLGGLANRPVYHLPFSRTPEYDNNENVISLQIDDLHKLMSQCMTEHGILLVQPEHVVSLKLMTVEEQIREGKPAANPLVKLQSYIYKHTLLPKLLPDDSFVGSLLRWLSQPSNHSSRRDATHGDYHAEHSGDAHRASDRAHKWFSLQTWIWSHARDILDESDEILHSRFQLIYTIGLEQYMDGYPDRWTITQQVLRLVKKHAHSLSRYSPDSMECECGPPGSFPHVRIAPASDIGRGLILSIVKDVIDGQLTDLDFQNVSPAMHRAIRSFISDEDLLPDTAKKVEEYAKGSRKGYLWSGLLILRGLLACDILLFALAEWRWRVNYGLVSQPGHRESGYRPPTSTMLAVPYRAKDVPAPNTQFGHPDLTIILTCLSYYYAGLTEEQLRVSFEMLLGQDDPSMEYELWVKEYDRNSVPDSLQKLGEINLRSSEQWDNIIFPLFTRNRAAIDFYLSRVVFLKEAKEFPSKLSASSWDLAENRERVITGFSGTNDGRWLLPTSVAQRDLDHQQGANARVLAYLLQPENESYTVTHKDGERWTTIRLLQMVVEQQPKIRVLLDVGAQILDFTNVQVARAWLDITPDATGAVYFNEDELMLLTRNGITQPMQSSPLSQQLGRCVVYLDHAHTRGTDIKLPIESRAAITLGPKVTKDTLVQGCMRMRKLGHGHSVMFFAPLEVDRNIRAVAGKRDPTARVSTVDILHWAIHETCTDIRRRAPYWAQQGMNHKWRYDAWSRFCKNELGPEGLSDAWLQPGLRSLADLYAPRETKSIPSTLSELDSEIRQCCRDLGVLSLPCAQIDEQQEREVNCEREREREVELPPRAEPVQHSLHPDVVRFVNIGVIPPLHSASAFRPVFATLEKSSAATREADVWSPYILATTDFCNTVRLESTRGTMDQYLRPVQWILTRERDHEQVLVLLSPFEADRLMPDIRASEHVHLHVYAPRTSRRMKPSDDLKLYSIPPLPLDWTPPRALIDQLNVFAGQLYLRDYKSYLRLCHFLDASTEESSNDTVKTTRWNLFDIPGSFDENEIKFSDSPLPFVWELLAIRNRGRPFTQTHMGKILHGHMLTEEDFERPTSAVYGESPATRCDRQIPHDAMPESTHPSSSAMTCDGQDSPAPALPRSWRRGLETAGISEIDSEAPQMHLRLG